jgi:microcystin-dependent protein
MGGSDAGRLSDAASSIATKRNTLGGTGGQVTHTLSTSEIPSHTHANSLSDPGHIHNLPNAFDNLGGPQITGAGGVPMGVHTSNTSSNTTGITITNAAQGGGGAHDNMPPIILGNQILRVL